MKKKIFFYSSMLIFLASANYVSGQVYQAETVYGRNAKRLTVDSTLRIPKGLSTRTNAYIGDSAGLIALKDTTDGVYYFTGVRWKQLAGAGTSNGLDSTTAAGLFVPLSRTISTGWGILGGGNLSANRTFTADSATLSGYYLRRVDSTTYGGYYPWSNPLGFITSSSLSGYVPTSRTITINGVAYDLSTNRAWSVGTLTGSDTSYLHGRGVASYAKNGTDDSTILTLNDGSRLAAKDNSGSGGITALTGDVTASGSGSVAATLATVNSNVGTFGSASKTITATVNAKGLNTAISEQNIAIAESQVTNLVSDLAGKEPALGNPASNGYVLSSTTSGTRSWIAQSGGSSGVTGDSLFNYASNRLERAPAIFPSVTDTVYFEGHSYTSGSGATTTAQRWSTILARVLGGVEKNNGVVGKTLMLQTPLNYQSVTAMTGTLSNIQTKTANRKALFFDFGLNDAGQTAAAYTLANYASAWDTVLSNAITTKGWPANKIFIMGIEFIGQTGLTYYGTLTGNTAPTYARMQQFDSVNRAKSLQYGVNYIEMYNRQYFNDTTLLGVSGNNAVHPTDAGYSFIAKAAQQSIGIYSIYPDSSVIRYSGSNLQHITSKNSIGNGGTAGSVTPDSANIYIGAQSGASATSTGYRNVGIGPASLKLVTSGYQNSSYGWNTASNNTTGQNNTAIGSGALFGNATGSDNTAIGRNTLNAAANYSSATAVGSGALALNTGNYSTAFGAAALALNTSGVENTAIGQAALQSNISGAANVALGRQTLYTNTGNYNTGIGYAALYAKVGGDGNTAIGTNADNGRLSGGYNIVIGAAVQAQSTTASGQLNIGNVIYGSGLYQSITSSSTPTTAGSIGIGLTTPTARLMLPAGTATASTSPLKFTSGTNLTAAEAGAMEYNGTNLFFSPSTTRYDVFMGLSGSATLDFGNTAAQTSAELTITVTGAADGDVVMVSPLNAAYNANSNYTARVSSTNTVSVAFNNFSAGAIDPASAVFKVKVIKN